MRREGERFHHFCNFISSIHAKTLVLFQHEILYNWVNPVYLDMVSQAQIQEEFEDRSETFLKDFFKVGPGNRLNTKNDVFYVGLS